MIVPIVVTPPGVFSPKLPAAIAALGHDELFLVELQGTLDVQGAEPTAKDGQLIGTLNASDMSKPTLVIGHHLLEGKVVRLAKPLAVLHKHVAVPASDHAGAEGEGETVRWDIVAVVKQKMVFSKRPMPASIASRRT